MAQEQDLDPRFHAFRPDLADITLKPFYKASRYVEPMIRQCVRGIVPLFDKPTEQAHRLSEVRYGEFVDLYEERDDGFAWVQNRYDGYVGYIPATGTLSEVIAALMNRVCVNSTFVYQEPHLNAPVKDRLTLGSFVSLDGDAGDFYPLASGGYVFKRHIAPSDEVECRDYIFTAGQMMNAPYLTGGRSATGFDATGLVQFVLDLAGIECPRAYEQQIEQFGRPLPCHWRDIIWTRGDLVFFDNPQHVGLMSGRTHIISADPAHMIVTVEPVANLVARGYTIIAAGKPS